MISLLEYLSNVCSRQHNSKGSLKILGVLDLITTSQLNISKYFLCRQESNKFLTYLIEQLNKPIIINDYDSTT